MNEGPGKRLGVNLQLATGGEDKHGGKHLGGK